MDRAGRYRAQRIALLTVALPLHLIREIFRKVQVAEEPASSCLPYRPPPAACEGAERRDTGTGPIIITGVAGYEAGGSCRCVQ